MAPEALPPNPIASRATTNDISLLLSSKATRLRSSALFRNLSSSSPSSKQPTTHANPAAEDAAFVPGGQNSGIGYVNADKSKTASDAATATLRNKLLGKRKGRGESGGGRRGGAESEEDEDEGRSGLGKRKKVRKHRREEEEDETRDTQMEDEAPEIEDGNDRDAKVDGEGARAEATNLAADIISEQAEKSKPKQNKKKKTKSKNKNKNKD